MKTSVQTGFWMTTIEYCNDDIVLRHCTRSNKSRTKTKPLGRPICYTNQIIKHTKERLTNWISTSQFPPPPEKKHNIFAFHFTQIKLNSRVISKSIENNKYTRYSFTLICVKFDSLPRTFIFFLTKWTSKRRFWGEIYNMFSVISAL